MDIDPVFLALLLVVWAGLGGAAWLGTAIVRRGRGVLAGLPPAIAGGIGAGVLVPAAGADNEAGLLLSLGAALLGGLVLSLAAIRIQTLLQRRARPIERATESSPPRTTNGG